MSARDVVSGAAGSAGAASTQMYVDDVFSTYLYTGNGATQTINNGIDLAGNGGLVWIKPRTTTSYLDHVLRSSEGDYFLYTNNTLAAAAGVNLPLTTTGFSNSPNTNVRFNTSAIPYVSWSFKKAAKFFDVVTSSTGTSTITFTHALGVAPGFVMIKKTSGVENWYCYHVSLGVNQYTVLNTVDAAVTLSGSWTVSTTSVSFNYASAGTYVAYIFAHNAATDGIIQCGSFTTDGSGNADINLGWEPQYMLLKTSGIADGWHTLDSIRGWLSDNGTGLDADLQCNTTNAESYGNGPVQPTSTGFRAVSGSATRSYIYMVIRRPNKPPTSGTQVFSANLISAPAATKVTTGIPLDLLIARYTLSQTGYIFSRELGISTSPGAQTENYLTSATTNGLNVAPGFTYDWDNTGFKLKAGYANAPVSYLGFKRAPGFLDVVYYNGGASALNITHNLGVVPGLKIIKSSTGTVFWVVGGNVVTGGTQNDYIVLNESSAKVINLSYWSSGLDTSTTFSTRTGNGASNGGGGNEYIAYLFATLAGVSKVGSYTGNGSSQTINCGFAAGARFILIKRTDAIGDWYVWDTARGIATGNDAYYSLNNTAAQVTTDDSIDPDNSGFIVNQVAATNINVTSATYILLAIA